MLCRSRDREAAEEEEASNAEPLLISSFRLVTDPKNPTRKHSSYLSCGLRAVCRDAPNLAGGCQNDGHGRIK